MSGVVSAQMHCCGGARLTTQNAARRRVSSSSSSALAMKAARSSSSFEQKNFNDDDNVISGENDEEMDALSKTLKKALVTASASLVLAVAGMPSESVVAAPLDVTNKISINGPARYLPS